MSQTLQWCGTLCFRLLLIVRLLQLVILFSEECLKLRGGVVFFVVGCLLLCDRYVWSYWFFEECLKLTRGCVILWCRLLVVVQPLRLVILVFEECLGLCGGVLLFNVGCWLLGDRYDWLYCFSTLLVVHAFCTVSCCGFLLGLYRRKFFHVLLYGGLSSHILNL